ncbi:twin-arginine translocase subunit TatC [Neosynechococcus sphagnicola]|uniref:twin-arginine translocase subunit TatC n=1 Tax=Neosynechococcus sphagnicola TaxID=1501145 RepID=UPI000A9619FF
MTPTPSDLETHSQSDAPIHPVAADQPPAIDTDSLSGVLPAISLDEVPDDVEMSLFDHLEELRQRIFYALIAIVVAIAGCFLEVKPIVRLLEVPAQGVKFLQLAPGE